MSEQVISANRLRDGLVVYLTTDGGWSEHIADAALLADEAASDAALARAQTDVDARLIVDPYPIDVALRDGERQPTRFRELIRAKGPTVRPDLGKQAEV